MNLILRAFIGYNLKETVFHFWSAVSVNKIQVYLAKKYQKLFNFMWLIKLFLVYYKLNILVVYHHFFQIVNNDQRVFIKLQTDLR